MKSRKIEGCVIYDHHYTHKLECDCPQSQENDRWDENPDEPDRHNKRGSCEANHVTFHSCSATTMWVNAKIFLLLLLWLCATLSSSLGVSFRIYGVIIFTDNLSGNGPVGSIWYKSWIRTAQATLLVGENDFYVASSLETISSDRIEHRRWTSRHQAHILLERLVHLPS
jgi:hypothetical protein